MKKSFKKSIAVLLSVLMMVCVMPFSAFAADSKPDVNLQFNAFSLTGTNKTFQSTGNWIYNAANMKKFGIYSAPLDYDKNAGTLTLSAAKAQTTSTAKGWNMTAEDHTYGVGDYFTVTVRLDNISKLAAAQVAIQYSDNIEPAGLYQVAATRFVFYSISSIPTSSTANDKMDTARAGYPIPTQSAKLYKGLNDGLVGDASYIDSDNRIIHTYVSNQDANSSTSVASLSDADLTNADGSKGNTYANQAVLATYAFKIIGTGAITFSMADASSVDDCYYIADENDGTDPSNYITYAQTDNAGSTGITFMGKNEFVAGTKYSITFKKADGTVISQADYDEGASIVVPDLPTKAADANYHYSYAWDTTPAATATDNAVYTAVETATRHTMSEEIIKDATTTETGTKRLTCDICGYTTTEIIPIKTCNHANTTTSEEVTKKATCKEEGSKTVTVTCSDCGTVVSTEVVAIPKTAHNWGVWTFNGDAHYDTANKTATDGTQTRKCSICGESETVAAPNTGNLFRIANQLTIDSSIIVKVLIPQSVFNYYDKVYMVAKYPTKEGEKTVVVEEYDFLSTYVRFAFENTMPHYMNEEVKYTFYGEKDGVTYWGDTYEYAVTTYIRSQLDKYSTEKYPTTYNNLRRLLADIIYYGYKAQIQQGYGITDGKKTPMTDYITEAQLAYRTTEALTLQDITNSAYETIASPTAKTGFSVRMGASVDLVITLAKNTSACPDLWSLQVEVTKEGSSPEIFNYENNPDMFAASGSYVNFYYNGVKGNEASVPVYVRLLDKDGNVISNTRRCSIESYCYTQLNKATASDALKGVCDAIMRYAKSSATYIANKTA